MLLVKLAVRYEDWCVGALNVEYFVKKIQAWTEDVQTISKEYIKTDSSSLSKKPKMLSIEEEAEAATKVQEEKEEAKKAEKLKKEKEEERLAKELELQQSKMQEKVVEEVSEPVAKEPPTEFSHAEGEEPPVELNVPFPYIRRYDTTSQKTYYENTEGKTTIWELPDGATWVDFTSLIFFLTSDVFRTTDAIQKIFRNNEGCEIQSTRKIGDDYVVVVFTNEQSAWNALSFLNIDYKTPERAYNNCRDWFQTAYDNHVRFLNTNDENLTSNHLKASKYVPPKVSGNDAEGSAATSQKTLETKLLVKKLKDRKKKKRKAFGNNKKMQHLAAKWDKVQALEKAEQAKNAPEAKAERERQLNEKWVLEDSGNTAETNPNLIKVKDWRQNLGIKKKN